LRDSFKETNAYLCIAFEIAGLIWIIGGFFSSNPLSTNIPIGMMFIVMGLTWFAIDLEEEEKQETPGTSA
jgi:hypothetical protein